MSEVFGTLMDLWPVTLAVGLAALWFGWKKLSGHLRFFVMLAGAAVMAFFLSVFLHNGISWLAGQLWGAGFEDPVFFALAVIACPLAFVVGVAGALVTWLRLHASHPR